MKAHFSILKTLFLSALVLSSVACKYDLVTEPTRDGNSALTSADYGDSILPPAQVQASQGNYRSVTISWDTVKNATQYQIFSADTPYDTFIQEGETLGKETTFTVENELTGITKYYLIKAVNYYGTVSKGSNIVTATTLDTPIITEINPSSEGNSISISWWMGNCNENTYAKNIQFIVTAYDENKNKIADSVTTVPGFANGKVQDTAEINGLKPSTNYYFTVEAQVIDSDQKSEKSDYTNAETAHRVIPDAPENLSATQGISTENVVLTWKLPSPVEYRDKKTMVYSTQPVYFTIERKLIDEDDSAYTVIEPYIGAYGDSGIEINCSNNTSNSSKVTVEKAADGITPEIYSNYTSLSTITYTDTTAERGKRYTYRIQSYTDDVKTPNSSEETSVAFTSGWQTPSAGFTAENILTVNEDESKITNIDMEFNVEFNNYNVPYTYVITQQRTAFGDSATPDAETIIYSSTNIKSVNSSLSTKHYSDTTNPEIQGKYLYKFYLLNGADENITSVPSEYLECIIADNEVSVTDDANAIPKITNFTVQDGYKNKFVLTWDEIPSTAEKPVIYTVKWSSPASSTIRNDGFKELVDSDFTISDGKITFNAPAESGDSRIFTLKAVKNGIPDTAVYESVSKTLGTAAPVSKSPDYKSITVSWPSVQMADTDYEVTAKYEDNSSAILETPVITEENGTVTCVINNPAGYDDITKSGLPISFTVKATNSVTGDYTEAPINVCTLGPALIKTSVDTNTIYENRIQMSWNKVEGAKGYIIYRTKYFYDDSWTNWEYERADTYYYDASADNTSASGKISNNGSEVSSIRAKISLIDGKYTLTDYDCDQTDTTSSYEMNQSQISWGIPFGYVVIPVNGDKDDFTFGNDSQYLNVTGGKAGVVYSNAFADQKTATYGYGLNVAAEKAQNCVDQKVSWAPSYFGAEYKPTIYYRLANRSASDSSAWTSLSSVNTSSGQKAATFVPKDRYSAYEYLVVYNNSQNSLNLKKSFENKLSKTEENRYTYSDAVNKEQLNKGYLLAVNFNATYGGTPSGSTYVKDDGKFYSEYVYWNNWDYDNRSIGPSSAEIYIFNKNLSACKNNTWIKVSDLDNNCTTVKTENLTNTTITPDTTSLSLKPVKLAGDDDLLVTPGPLMVLRDAKHYYKLVFNGTEGTTDELSIGNEINTSDAIYAYRQISDMEKLRSAIITLNSGMYLIGKLDFETKSFSGENGGTISATHISTMNIGKEYDIPVTSYAPNISTPSGLDACSFKVTVTLKAYRPMGTQGGYTNSIDSTTITVAPYNETSAKCVNNLETYSGTITFAVSSNKSATVTCGTAKPTIDTAEKRRKYVPFIFNSDENWYHENKDYDWWN